MILSCIDLRSYLLVYHRNKNGIRLIRMKNVGIRMRFTLKLESYWKEYTYFYCLYQRVINLYLHVTGLTRKIMYLGSMQMVKD